MPTNNFDGILASTLAGSGGIPTVEKAQIPNIPYSTEKIMWDNNFDRGPGGWVQLIDGTRPRGIVTLDRTITASGSRHSLRLNTASMPDISLNGGQCMAIRRMARGPLVKKVFQEYYFAFGSRHTFSSNGAVTTDAPRALQWGLDQADLTGARSYFKLRWLQCDNAPNTRVTKFQILKADGTFMDVPGAVVDFPYNENKRNLHHLEIIFDVENNCYDGFRINGQGFGSLAAVPNASLRAYSPELLNLVAFAGGFNAATEVLNRTDSWFAAEAWMNIGYTRGALVGGEI